MTSAKVSKFAEEAGIDGLNQWPAILGNEDGPRSEIVFNLPRSQVQIFNSTRRCRSIDGKKLLITLKPSIELALGGSKYN